MNLFKSKRNAKENKTKIENAEKKEIKSEIETEEKKENQRPFGTISSVNWQNKKGIIVTFKGDEFSFLYKNSSIPPANIKLNLKVHFEVIEKNGNLCAINVDKEPVTFGFLNSHDDDKNTGLFQIHNSTINFSYNQLRNDDKPLFDKIYYFDVIEEPFKDYYPIIDRENNSEEPQAGQIRLAKIKTISPKFGYFVDIGFSRDALVFKTEISWDDNSIIKYKVGDEIEVLITQTKIENNELKIGASIKALVKRPIKLAAYNIFRLDKMPLEIKKDYLVDLTSRENILPQIKINAISLITEDKDLYRAFKNDYLPCLYEYCRKQFEVKLNEQQYDDAYELLLEYCNYNFDAIELTNKFPKEFLDEINSTHIDMSINNEIDNNELDISIFARKNNISKDLAKKYLEKVSNVFNTNIEIDDDRSKIGLNPYIIINEE